jgi:type IV pilus assembly protein PilW
MNQRGFSLIELMIAVTLGMLAVAAVGSVFIYGSRNYKQDDKVSRMQDELRFAMAQITQDIEMAGFFAQVRDLTNDIDLLPATGISAGFSAGDCGPTMNGAAASSTNNWVFRERRASIFTYGNATAAQANATFPCITAANFKADTDVLAIKRLGSATTAQEDGKAYLRTNGVQTTLYVRPDSPGPNGDVCDPADPTDDDDCAVTIYEYKPVVWFIRPWSASATENPQVPSLCRMVFRGGVMQEDSGGCVASGIADLQLEFGFDVADAGGRFDGLADYFGEIGTPLTETNTANPHPMAAVVAVRVHLLGQSTAADVGYKNIKTYQLAGTTRPAFNDGYYRRALSSTVLVRNAMNRLNPYSLPSR